jgi:hypothetical protein
VEIISISLVVQFSGFCLADSTFGNSLSSSILGYVHACQLVDSENLIDHHDGHLVQIGALIDLEWELK